MSEKADWERAWDSADEHPNIDGFTYKEGFRIGYLAAKSEQEAAIRAAKLEVIDEIDRLDEESGQKLYAYQAVTWLRRKYTAPTEKSE